jgi:hypothetical protein
MENVMLAALELKQHTAKFILIEMEEAGHLWKNLLKKWFRRNCLFNGKISY